jgi:hypothetical protein
MNNSSNPDPMCNSTGKGISFGFGFVVGVIIVIFVLRE